MPFLSAKQLEPDFAKAVFALERSGEISNPIKGTAAWHVVRLDERRPAGIPKFDDVRDSILKDLRNRYLAEQRDLRIQSIYHDPTLQLNQPAIDALVNHVDYSKLEHPAAEKPGDCPPTPASTQAPAGGHGQAPPEAAPAAK